MICPNRVMVMIQRTPLERGMRGFDLHQTHLVRLLQQKCLVSNYQGREEASSGKKVCLAEFVLRESTRRGNVDGHDPIRRTKNVRRRVQGEK